MRNLLTLVVGVLSAPPALAQAPEAAELWRVAAASLSRPAALQRGPSATFWNPAADGGRSFAVGGQVVRTSDILGLSGFVIGATRAVGPVLDVGLVLGRMDVRDLVRTTTSPNSQEGSIPVFEQLAGVAVRLGTGRVRAGAQLRVHDARFDAEREQGATLDLGLTASPVDRVTIALATHFLPVDFSTEPTTDYYAGAEYVVLPGVVVANAQVAVAPRYGVTVRHSGDVEHAVGLGLTVNHLFTVDGVVTGESAYGARLWRSAVGVGFTVGRYTIHAARSSGLNDVGSTFRVGLDVGLDQ